ncbi:MAG: hypothetical protein KDC07_12260, partial [Chitinophagaceae bacterium]|nr:hypothetical protein [Chitinophagaceae bacterium]
YNDVTPGQLEQLKEQRLEELSKPDTSTPSLIRFRYLFALAGVPGIILGLVIYTHKKTLPNGENVYVYSYDSRKKALVVIAISTLFLLLYICMALYRHLSNSY